MPAHSRLLSPATITGLFVALLLPFVTYEASAALFGDAQSLARVNMGFVVHWASFFLLIAIVRTWEREPLASIGVRPFRWRTIPAGLAAAIVIAVVSAALNFVLELPADTQTVAYLQSLPFAVRLLLVVTAGVFEETMYRGYALERLTTLFGNKWLAGLVTMVLFTLAHAPAFGLRNVLPVAIVSTLVTLLYLWRRDLILNMVTHAAFDALGLLLAPALTSAAQG